jgi:hypothetical protein
MDITLPLIVSLNRYAVLEAHHSGNSAAMYRTASRLMRMALSIKTIGQHLYHRTKE